MNNVTKRITVDVSRPNIFDDLFAKQADTLSRFLQIDLTHEGEKIEVKPGSTVYINVSKQDGHFVKTEGTVNGDGSVTVELTNQALAIDGTITCDISVEQDGSILSSASFEIKVQPKVIPEDVEVSTDEFGDLQKALAEVKELMQYGGNIESGDLGKLLAGGAVDGLQLSHNDYTNADKASVQTIKDKVDKVAGKGLSTNDYTNADKEKVGKSAYKGVLTDCHAFDGAGIYAVPYTAANFPEELVTDSSAYCTLIVSDSESAVEVNRYALTLITPFGQFATKPRDGNWTIHDLVESPVKWYTATDPDAAVEEGICFIPAFPPSPDPIGNASAIIIVKHGDVGGGNGIFQTLVTQGKTYTRVRDVSGTWNSWQGGDGAISDADLQAIKDDCILKNQGTENVGKILVVGTDGNFTLTDMPEGGASGDVTGTLDGNYNILLSGNLADGTYTLSWVDAEGNVTGGAGTLEVGAIAPAYTNLAEPNESNTTDFTIWCNNARMGGDGVAATRDGYVCTNYFAVSPGSVVRYKHFKTERIGFYDASKNPTTSGIGRPGAHNASHIITNISSDIDLTADPNGEPTEMTFTINKSGDATATIAYCRLSGWLTGAAEDVIITVNEEIV